MWIASPASTSTCGRSARRLNSSLISVHYIVIPRDAGGSYMLSLIDTGDGTKAEEIAGKVYSIAVPM